jgi:hypothetical protein
VAIRSTDESIYDHADRLNRELGDVRHLVKMRDETIELQLREIERLRGALARGGAGVAAGGDPRSYAVDISTISRLR